MEKLNDYLQSLLSSCSEELRLEPDKNPYLVAENRTTDVGNVPLMGTQISTMVFPLIPPEIKSTLPNTSEIQFVHPHNLGNFNFTVQKSPAGFIVTIRPMINDSNGSTPVSHTLPAVAPTISTTTSSPVIAEQPSPTSALEPEPEPVPVQLASYDLESSAAAYDLNAAESVETAAISELIFDENTEYVLDDENESEIEVVAVNDPEFQTVFSDSSAYEPPGRRDEFELGDFVPFETEATVLDENLDSQPAPVYGSLPQAQEVVQTEPIFQPPPLTPAIARCRRSTY